MPIAFIGRIDGISGIVRAFRLRPHAIGFAGDDQLVDRFHGPWLDGRICRVHQFLSKPVKPFLIRRLGTISAKVGRGCDQRGSEMPSPDMIDCHSGGQWNGWAGDPFGQSGLSPRGHIRIGRV